MRFLKIIISALFIFVMVFTFYVKFSQKTDYAAPTISCSNEIISVSVNDSNDKLLSFVSATDEKDGDLSNDIIVESVSPFIGKNKAKITFAVCDSDSNVSKLEKDLVYYDYNAPEFKFDTQHVYYVGATKVDLLSGVSAFDSLDGDISSRVVVSDSQIDLSQPGVYPVTYRVITSKGVTSEIDINAYVYASRLSENINLSTYLVYTDKDNIIDPQNYIVSYPEEYVSNRYYYGGYRYSFDIIDEVDYSTPDVYYITYRLTRTSSNDGAQVIAEAYLAVAVRGENK